MTEARITHIGGPTALIEAAGWRILTDPTFDPPGKRYFFGWGTTSKKLAGPSLSPAEVGDIDAVLISHHHHGDNLDPTGRALLPGWGTVVTTQKAARDLGAGTGLRPWETTTLQAAGKPTITITATPCRHGPPGMDPITGPVIGFSLRWEGQQHGELWITGDTVLYPGLREVPQRLNIGTVVAHLGAVRFAYLTGPFRYSMDGREAAELMALVHPTSVIPVHYEGWSHFKQDRPEAEPELAALGDVVHWADPGESTLVVV
ncbi:MAG TPA: MBL fold metallo-hydrolase [Aeromicrobium sp.]|nr:MBL fold metallo-hydrolase [Aeromicrobium sp.]